MNGSPDTTAASLAKAGVGTAAPSQRLLRLGAGLFITFSPLAVWGLMNLALGSDFVEKNSWRVHLDPVQIRIWLLIAAGLLELVAVFLSAQDGSEAARFGCDRFADRYGIIDFARGVLLGADQSADFQRDVANKQKQKRRRDAGATNPSVKVEGYLMADSVCSKAW